MAALKSILIIAFLAYALVLAAMYFGQRALMYFPDRARTLPTNAGLPQAAEEILTTADGEKLIVWHVPARDDKPVVIYFQGNGGALVDRVSRFRALIEDGTGLIALSYRGYGGSTGSPSEEGLIADARAAYAFVAARYPAERIALWGESLGTAIAIALAAEQPVARVMLQAPFTSAADVGAAAYFFVPVRLFMKDTYRSDLRISKVKAPVLILHGVRDRVIPIAYGERLFAMIPGEKRFVRFDAGEHIGLDPLGALVEVRKFLAGKAD